MNKIEKENLFIMKGFGFGCSGEKYRAGLRVYSEKLWGNEYVAALPNRESGGYDVWKLLHDFYFNETHGGIITDTHKLRFSSRLKRELFKLTGSGSNFFVTRMCSALADSRKTSLSIGKAILMRSKLLKANLEFDSSLIAEISSHSNMLTVYIRENLKSMMGRKLTFKDIFALEKEELKKVPGVIKDFMFDYKSKGISFAPNNSSYSGKIIKAPQKYCLRGNMYYIQENNLIGECYEYKNIFREFLFRRIFLNTNYKNYEDEVFADIKIAFRRIYNKRKDIFSFELTRGCAFALLYYAFLSEGKGALDFMGALKGFSKRETTVKDSLVTRLGDITGFGYRKTYDYMRKVQSGKVKGGRLCNELIGLQTLMLMKNYIIRRRKDVGIPIVKNSFFDYLMKVVHPPTISS